MMDNNLLKCSNCDGHGLVSDYNSEPTECSFCGGEGYVLGEHCIRCDIFEEPQFIYRNGYCEHCYDDMFKKW